MDLHARAGIQLASRLATTATRFPEPYRHAGPGRLRAWSGDDGDSVRDVKRNGVAYLTKGRPRSPAEAGTSLKRRRGGTPPQLIISPNRTFRVLRCIPAIVRRWAVDGA